MLRLSVTECAIAMLADVRGAEGRAEEIEVAGVSIDTRTLKAGELYIAIRGEHYDGHTFVDKAVEAGAAALVLEEPVSTDLPQLIVADTRDALTALAQNWFERHQIQTVAITGSNGKTTVKEIIATILRQLGPVLATRGNLNNDIGVPLTMLELNQQHRYAVIEMGASKAGDIRQLVSIVKPEVAVITSIAAAHLEGFGSVEGVATAKAELFLGLSNDGWAVFNADGEYAATLREAARHCHVRDFGVNSGVDVRGIAGSGMHIETCGRQLKPRFRLVGDHNGLNALAAVAAVQCLDVQSPTIMLGLEAVRAIPGRLESKSGLLGSTIIDDSYNANPASTRVAIELLAELQGKRHLVLGDMAELGPDAAELHAEAGRLARRRGIDGLWTTGELSKSASTAFHKPASLAPSGLATGVVKLETVDAPVAEGPESRRRRGGHFDDHLALLDALHQELAANSTVLVKGSRSAHMERVVAALLVTASESKSSEVMS
ncbi:MAG: UDP-N-acetylmuramoyl-tripeptide--D-alanyl-D-alanine ligase [Granulosicoccus sp.]